MPLSMLPSELKLNIAQYLDPESTLNFALTCKEYATHCKSTLNAHHRKLSERQVIDTTNGGILWKLLKEVLHDPSVGWYVRELNLPATRQYSWEDGEANHKETPSNEDKELFDHAARRLQNLYPVEERYDDKRHEYPFDDKITPSDLVGSVQKRISGSSEDGIIVILLHYLPFLDTIRLTAVDNDCFELALWHIVDKYKSSTRSAYLPLRHLTTAAVTHWDSEMCCHADWACFFTELPSLRTFVAGQMGGVPRLEAAHEHRLSANYVPNSNVTELFFHQCQFDVDGLATILAGLRNLRKFTYTGAGSIVSDEAYYEPKKVIRALAKHAGNSLEELVLEQDNDVINLSDRFDLNMASLRDFQNLRLLECGWDILRPTEGDEGEDADSLEEGFYQADDEHNASSLFDPRTIFPESLQELYIHGQESDFADDVWNQLVEMFKSTSASTPNLRPEKTCIRKCRGHTTVDVIGEADAPGSTWDRPLLRLLDDHGY